MVLSFQKANARNQINEKLFTVRSNIDEEKELAKGKSYKLNM